MRAALTQRIAGCGGLGMELNLQQGALRPEPSRVMEMTAAGKVIQRVEHSAVGHFSGRLDGDPLCSSKCGSGMKPIAFIERHQIGVIRRILRHCGLNR